MLKLFGIVLGIALFSTAITTLMLEVFCELAIVCTEWHKDKKKRGKKNA